MTLGSHQRTVGKSQVHLTPKWIIDALGPFDLDPCAADPRPWDCATRNVTEAEDGLAQSWEGRVWLNPPFDRYQVGKWVEKLGRHNHGTLLVHARTETDWFAKVWEHADLLLFLDSRITFCRPDGSPCTVLDKRTGQHRQANSGAPVVLAAFGAADVQRLRGSGLSGFYVWSWAHSAKMEAA